MMLMNFFMVMIMMRKCKRFVNISFTLNHFYLISPPVRFRLDLTRIKFSINHLEIQFIELSFPRFSFGSNSIYIMNFFHRFYHINISFNPLTLKETSWILLEMTWVSQFHGKFSDEPKKIIKGESDSVLDKVHKL